MTITTWRERISVAMNGVKDDWQNVVACTLDDNGLDKKFDDDFGGPEGEPFTLWTKDNVYFPVEYDGSEWATSVSRNPNNQKTVHVGRG